MTASQATDTYDGTAVEVGTDLEHVPPPQPPTNLFGTDDPVEVIEKAARVADALKDVIVSKGLFTMIQGKAHIGVEGWQLVGAMLGVTAVCVRTEPVDGGYVATVEARAADGRVIGSADAMCTKHEKRGPWKSADDYARLSMAQTRATSKALKGPLGFVVSLAGYATTPAEEMTFAQPDAAPTNGANDKADEPAATPAGEKPIGKTAGKQLDDQLGRYIEAGLEPDRLNMQAVALGGELDESDEAPSMWHLLNREQGKALYEWMQAEVEGASA